MRRHFPIMKFTLRTILLSTICLTWSHTLLAQTFTQNNVTYTATSANEVKVSSGPNSETVTIPATVINAGTTYNVTEIDNMAFYNKGAVANITIPISVTKIGDWAFYACGNLATINLPETALSIGVGAFDGTTWYNNQADGMVYIGKVAYKYKGTMANDTTIAIKAGTLALANYVFEGCTTLESVSIPNSVTRIGEFAFRGCTALTSITIPSSVTTIGNSAFSGCTGLTNVVIPSSISTINSNVFFRCTGLTGVSIPGSVTTICSYAFKDCTSLNPLNVPSTVTTIGIEAFSNVPNVKYSGSATGSPWGANSITH